jgi:hypothetical protein
MFSDTLSITESFRLLFAGFYKYALENTGACVRTYVSYNYARIRARNEYAN